MALLQEKSGRRGLSLGIAPSRGFRGRIENERHRLVRVRLDRNRGEVVAQNQHAEVGPFLQPGIDRADDLPVDRYWGEVRRATA